MPSYTVELNDAEGKLLEELAATNGYKGMGDPSGLADFMYLIVQMGMSAYAGMHAIPLPDDPADRLKPLEDGIPF